MPSSIGGALLLIGLSWDVEAPFSTLGIVSIDPKAGNITLLAPLGEEVFEITEATYDILTQTFFVLPRGNILRPFDVKKRQFGTDVKLDISGCDGGGGCFQELHFWNGAIFGVGVGWNGGVTPVRIDLATGAVAAAGPALPLDTAIVTDASALDASSGSLYVTVVFAAQEPSGGSTVYLVLLR